MNTRSMVVATLAALCMACCTPKTDAGLTQAEHREINRVATDNVRDVFRAAQGLHAKTSRFPGSTALTPAETPTCSDGRPVPFAPNPEQWMHPSWEALDFAVNEPSYFRYQFTSTGSGAEAHFKVVAHGDLDCDGVQSTFERVGHITPDGEVSGGAGLFVMSEYE